MKDRIMDEKAYGHEVEVECCDTMVYIPGARGNHTRKVRRIGPASKARHAAILLPHAREIIRVTPYTREEWERCFGIQQRM